MNEHNKAKGTAGEWLVAGLLQLQGAEAGFRIADINVDDDGTDLILTKNEKGQLKLVAEIQVKTATKIMTKTQVEFRMSSLRARKGTNLQRFYIFLYCTNVPLIAWLMSEEELRASFSKQITTGNVSFSIKSRSNDRASSSKVPIQDLLKRILLRLS